MNKTVEKPYRRYPIGAELQPDGGVHFRVWAPGKKKLKIHFEKNAEQKSFVSQITEEDEGYFSGFVHNAKEGMLYRFSIDDDEKLLPDPASHYQPLGPHGPSQIVNPEKYRWRDHHWNGVELDGQIIYEMHIGTFTKEGTWKAAAEQLNIIADLGITIIEMMPIADFAGKFGWGYDGVNLFAPTRLYGTPDELRHFIDAAHSAGIAVILDVVYNHLGPDGNYMKFFSEYYFSKKYKTDWGEAINFDDQNSKPVREFFLTNAVYWINDFHLDGLRIDATQDIFDKSSPHILKELNTEIKNAAPLKKLITIAENESQDTKIIKPVSKGGYGIDAVWNDDYHHSAMVALTGRKEAYYSDYQGSPQEFISSAKYGFIFQGQLYKWQSKRRGTPTKGIKLKQFINFIQNHDQIANSGRGYYCHKLTSPGRFKAMSALLLLLPQTPMIFQGQEFAASNSFFYFADHKKELAELIHKGRAEFLAQFRSLSLPETQAAIPDPADVKTFYNSKIDFSEREKNHEIYNMYKDLIHLRKHGQIISQQGRFGIDGAVLGKNVFLIRFFSHKGKEDRLLIINFGVDLDLNPAPEPLLAPPFEHVWEIIFSTEDVKYGGIGTAPLETEENWKIPGHCGVVLKPLYNKEKYFETADKKN